MPQPTHPHGRAVTISTMYQQRANGRGRTVPYLRLRGAWLQAFGFGRGEKVQIAAEHGRLVITLDVE